MSDHWRRHFVCVNGREEGGLGLELGGCTVHTLRGRSHTMHTVHICQHRCSALAQRMAVWHLPDALVAETMCGRPKPAFACSTAQHSTAQHSTAGHLVCTAHAHTLNYSHLLNVGTWPLPAANKHRFKYSQRWSRAHTLPCSQHVDACCARWVVPNLGTATIHCKAPTPTPTPHLEPCFHY
jgi:hypothetical protein